MTYNKEILFELLLEKSRKRLASLMDSGWIGESSEDTCEIENFQRCLEGKEYAGCFTVLLTALDVKSTDEEICAALPKKNTFLNNTELLNGMAILGYVSHSVAVNLKFIDPRLMPCLYMPLKGDDANTYPRVILSSSDGVIDIYDGKQDKVIQVNEKDLKRGNVWFFHDENKEDNSLSRLSRKTSGVKWFRALLDRFRSFFWQVFSLSVFINILALSVPLFVMFSYDKVVSSHDISALNPLFIGVSIAICLELLLRFLRGRILSWFAARIDYIIGTSIFERLMLMPAMFTERAYISSQINRLKAFESVRDFFISPLFLSIVETPFVIVLLVVMYVISGPLVFVPITVAFIYILLILIMHRRVRVDMARSGAASSSRQQMVIDTLDKLEGFRTSGVTKSWVLDFRELSGRSSLLNFKSTYVASIIEVISHAVYIISGMSILLFGVERIWSGHMSSGALIATMIISWRVLSPIQSLCTSLPRYEQLKKAINQINRLMDIEEEATVLEDTATLDDFKGKLSFSKVGLRYTRDTDPVFTGLSFDVNPGELVAITGVNGSGKSTILKLIGGLYKPQIGSVLIDGIDIRQMDPLKLRRHIAYVPQDPDVFTGTIAENIRFANPLASDDDLREAFRMTGGIEYIDRLPKGLYTMVGSGAGVSFVNEVTEKVPEIFYYHIGLARAYVKKAHIILFDELPYAFLNSPPGEKFRTILKEWKGSHTIMFVTYREDYIDLADQVIVLRNDKKPFIGNAKQAMEIATKNSEE